MAKDGGLFGAWSRDEAGLPCFDLDIDSSFKPLVVPAGDARRIWHQVGNDRVTATAHAGGWTAVYFCDRGFMRVGEVDPGRPAALGGMWRFEHEGGAIDPLTAGFRPRTRWGMGYARWEGRTDLLSIRRRVWVPFGDLPALCADVEVEVSCDGWYEERWSLDLYALILGLLMSRWMPPPDSHRGIERLLWRGMFVASAAMRRGAEAVRKAFRSRVRMKFTPLDKTPVMVAEPEYMGPFRPRSADTPAYFDAFLKPLFLAVLDGDASVQASPSPPRLCARVRVNSGVVARLRVAFGCASKDDIPGMIETLRAVDFVSTAACWGAQVSVTLPEVPWLERELAWHGYYLRSAQVRDDYFEATILPQGSAYGFVHGLQGAVRDYALAAVPLTFLHPAGARDNLRLMMRMTEPDGMMYYSHTGHGLCTSVGVHKAPSDLPLFLLWSLSEYVWATGDTEFLNEIIPFYPKHRGAVSTVRERVCLAWRYLRDRIGCGEHGLLRVGSGDWSDPISMMARNRRAFHKYGESAFNTAMAIFVLPRAADLLEPTHPEIAREIRSFAAELRGAMDHAWTGRWFLRGWDGQGRPIGAQHLFLDSNVWVLIAKVGSHDQRARLVEEIRRLLDEPSPIGALILDRPHPVRGSALVRGWDCNGGVWAAINGLLAWGYALHDPELAWRNLQKQSLAAHARAYPHVWYGIWSGPDAYNAHYADRPGETFVHPATPMTEFPLMNSNVHAMPLLAALRLAGVETIREGIRIERRFTAHGPWRLHTPLLDVEFDGAQVRAATHAVGGIGGRAALLYM